MVLLLGQLIHILELLENARQMVVLSKFQTIPISQQTTAMLYKLQLLDNQSQFALMPKHGNSTKVVFSQTAEPH